MSELLRNVPWSSFLIPATVAIAGYLTCFIVLWVMARVSKRPGAELSQWIVAHLRRPLLLLVPTLLLRLSLPLSDLSGSTLDFVRQTVAILLIVGVGWLLISLTSVLDEFLDERFLLTVQDNLMARRIHTKFRLLRRVVVIALVVFTAGAILMTFPAVRHLGAGLLASAGILGLVLGIAARPTVETLIAGMQLALTEPINLDDVVIVEGEWGRIEEITTTYVVVRIWDDRRLIVPVSYFLTHPFQNWTRVTADLIGQVTVEVDYTTPVEQVREEVARIVDASQHWDRRFWNLQVTEAGERTMRLRVLLSAGDSSSGWNLRCEVREKLITFLQEQHPGALPRLRAELQPDPASRGQNTAVAHRAEDDPPPSPPNLRSAPK